ncbi:retrovirus polyprotein, putative [Talaromyces marneffei ATCC 18224]|uniref:RNA-directed DNA polymerase n=1 Tax=Talaromyces marneffei (strain ATCC 18224 / CBS 334.59 / QM 7333) TaxID=441960 RepID=B6QN56_TALMQ|nr:retrovirus polyprotein, putative [Talaromyces marneffei ATCC 18224]
MDNSFARKNNLQTFPLHDPRALWMFNGEVPKDSIVREVAQIRLKIGNHYENTFCFLTQLGLDHPVILGIPWLREHNPEIDWSLDHVKFNSSYCRSNCFAFHLPRVVKSQPIRTLGIQPQWTDPRTPLQINFVNAAALHTIIRRTKDDLELCRVTLPDIEKTLKKLENKEPPPDLRSLIPECYHDLIDVFKAELSEVLPPHGPHDHQIKLMEGKQPPVHPLCRYSADELQLIQAWLKSNLNKYFIRPSNSAAAAPILLARKPGGGVRICVDYRGLNEITKKNRYPIPLIQETLQMLTRARYFTKLDIIAAFNKLRIAAGDEWKTAFRTRFGLFESLVMNFRLTNAPASWQNYINNILKEYLDDFVCAYMDDILIFSKTLSEYKRHVRQVLEKLKESGLQCNINKISIDPSKVATILEWQTPRSVKDVQAFLSFANFYRRFILGYSRIVKRLTNLTKKGLKFLWTGECQEAFDTLKTAFTIAPILKTFKWDKRCIVEVDSSDYVTGGVLSQYNDNGDLWPVAFFSKMHAPAECNYEIYDKELMAIIRAFEEWRPELQGNPHPIEVITDHKNLEYFTQKKLLNRRQARWAEFLSQFNYKLIYRPGKLGGKPDALTRWSQDWPHEPDDACTVYREQVVLRPQHLEWLSLNAVREASQDGAIFTGAGPLFFRFEDDEGERDDLENSANKEE